MGDHEGEDYATVQVDNCKNILIGLGIFGGLFFFFIMDKGMRVLNGGGDHSHGHTHRDEHDHDHAKAIKDDAPSHDNLRQRKKPNDDKKIPPPQTKTESSVKLSTYLNLFADFTHNMTDGLAMAASFYASPAVGATTAVAVFFHEIPHEVGDYAILVRSGFSKKNAMMAQFTTAVGAFIGTIIGIMIEEVARSGEKVAVYSYDGLMGTDLQWSGLVIPFTAGGFLYIATVGVIPELLEVTGKPQKDRRQAFFEFVAMLVGLWLMVVIAWNDIHA